MTEDHARAKLEELGTSARNRLQAGCTVHLRWEPGNMTAYEMLLVPWEDTTEMPWEGHKPQMASGGSYGTVYVIRFGIGGGRAYPLKLWDYTDDGGAVGNVPDAYYCEEKWASGLVDGHAIHLLLSAIAGTEPRSTFEDARCHFDAVPA